MSEKTFLEILTEKIEKQILTDMAQAQTLSNFQTNRTSTNEKKVENVENSSAREGFTTQESTPYVQWMSQIPLGKIQFSTPRERVFGRVYPINTPRPKPEPPRQKHVLSEKQKQAVVYFWGWQIRLQEDFTSAELKKAFRQLAQRLHPDKNGGKTKAFIEMKAHYNCLLSVFDSKSA